MRELGYTEQKTFIKLKEFTTDDWVLEKLTLFRSI
jgi:hypothetical protein